ncbi:MAG: PIG-L family deacetylase [Myxococcota bacterium]
MRGPGGLTDLGTLTPIAVVAPHPDDETLGCGGLLALCADRGLRADVLTLTDGAASHPSCDAWPPWRLAEERRREQTEALAILGLRRPSHHFDLPDGRLSELSGDAVSSVVARLRQWLHRFACVFVTAADDEHPDHRAAHRWVAQASPDLPRFGYSVWPPEERARGDLRLPLGERAAKKKSMAIACFHTQLGESGPEGGFAMPPGLRARALSGEERFSRD